MIMNVYAVENDARNVVHRIAVELSGVYSAMLGEIIVHLECRLIDTHTFFVKNIRVRISKGLTRRFMPLVYLVKNFMRRMAKGAYRNKVTVSCPKFNGRLQLPDRSIEIGYCEFPEPLWSWDRKLCSWAKLALLHAGSFHDALPTSLQPS